MAITSIINLSGHQPEILLGKTPNMLVYDICFDLCSLGPIP